MVSWVRYSAAAVILLLAGLPLGPCSPPPAPPESPETRLHAFYYGWYGTPEIDGKWMHWNHAITTADGRVESVCKPPEDIGADFYPASGPYSSSNPDTVNRHCAELQQAGIGVVVVSWWGKDSPADRALSPLFAAAEKTGISISFHLEPWPGRNAESIRDALSYLLDRWGDSPALFRWQGKPMVYVYDSYLVPDCEWAALLWPDGAYTIRGTPLDCIFIGLWVRRSHGKSLAEAGFDGFCTYFATAGFTWGSTPDHWPEMARFARITGKLFIPSVGPGYNDQRIRPWNSRNYRDRQNGVYYDQMFQAAMNANPDIISITSFNEWHEGTQIEPAVPYQTMGRVYEDYGGLPTAWYLERTRYWRDKWLQP